MNSFKIFNGNEGEYDTREDPRVSTSWSVGTSVILANFENDVKIFKPKFSLFLARRNAA